MSFHPSNRRSGVVLALGLATLTFAAGPATTAEPAKPRAAQLQSMLDCRKETDSAARLACFDAAAAMFDAAEQSGEVVVVDRAQVREARKAAFGFNFQMPSFMTQGAKPEELDRVTATVESARRDARGKWIIRLTDGATWRQIDSITLGKDPRAGSTVEIRTAMLGSFFMKIDGQTAIRATREN